MNCNEVDALQIRKTIAFFLFQLHAVAYRRWGGGAVRPRPRLGVGPQMLIQFIFFFTSAGFCNSQHFCSVIIIVYNKNEPET